MVDKLEGCAAIQREKPGEREKQKPHEAQHREVQVPAPGAPQAPVLAGAAWLEGPGEPGGQEVEYYLNSRVHQSLK